MIHRIIQWLINRLQRFRKAEKFHLDFTPGTGMRIEIPNAYNISTAPPKAYATMGDGVIHRFCSICEAYGDDCECEKNSAETLTAEKRPFIVAIDSSAVTAFCIFCGADAADCECKRANFASEPTASRITEVLSKMQADKLWGGDDKC